MLPKAVGAVFIALVLLVGHEAEDSGMSRWTGPGSLKANKEALEHPRYADYIARARKVAGDVVRQMGLAGNWFGTHTVRIADDAVVRVSAINNLPNVPPLISMELMVTPSGKEDEDFLQLIPVVHWSFFGNGVDQIIGVSQGQATLTPPSSSLLSGGPYWIPRGRSVDDIELTWNGRYLFWGGRARLAAPVGNKKIAGAVVRSDGIYVVIEDTSSGVFTTSLYRGTRSQIEREGFAAIELLDSAVLNEDAATDGQATGAIVSFAVSDDKSRAAYVRHPRWNAFYLFQEVVVDFETPSISVSSLEGPTGTSWNGDFLLAVGFPPESNEVIRLFAEVLPGAQDGFMTIEDRSQGDFVPRTELFAPEPSVTLTGFATETVSTKEYATGRLKIVPQQYDFLPQEDIFLEWADPALIVNHRDAEFFAAGKIDGGSFVDVVGNISVDVGAEGVTKIGWADLRNQRLLLRSYRRSAFGGNIPFTVRRDWPDMYEYTEPDVASGTFPGTMELSTRLYTADGLVEQRSRSIPYTTDITMGGYSVAEHTYGQLAGFIDFEISDDRIGDATLRMRRLRLSETRASQAELLVETDVRPTIVFSSLGLGVRGPEFTYALDALLMDTLPMLISTPQVYIAVMKPRFVFAALSGDVTQMDFGWGGRSLDISEPAEEEGELVVVRGGDRATTGIETVAYISVVKL